MVQKYFLPIFMLIISIFCFGTILVTSYSNRLAADDFSYGLITHNYGIFGSQYHQWMTWSGRLMPTGIITLVTALTEHSGSIFIYSLFLMILLFISSYFMLRQLFNNSMSKWNYLLLTTFFISILFYLTPNVQESFFWLSGSATYLMPVIITLYLIGRYLSQKDRQKLIIADFLLTFIVVTGNETYGALLIFSLLSVLVYEFIYTKKARPWLLLMLTASILGYAVMYIAPGNDNRLSHYVQNPPDEFILLSVTDAIASSYNILRVNWKLFTLIVMGISTLSFQNNENRNVNFKRLGWAMLCFIGINIIYYIPARYSMGSLPPNRSDITLVFSWILFILFITRELYSHIRPYITKYPLWFSLILLINIIWVSYRYRSIILERLSLSIESLQYSMRYDRIYNQLTLKDSRNASLDVYLPKNAGLVYHMGIVNDPSSWINMSVSKFFDLTSIQTK